MSEVHMSCLEEETARTAILRNRVSGLEEDLEVAEAQRDKLVAGLEAEVVALGREIDSVTSVISERIGDVGAVVAAEGHRACALSSTKRLRFLLDECKGGDDGDDQS